MPKKITLLSYAEKHREVKKEVDKEIIRFLKSIKPGRLLNLNSGLGFEADFAQRRGFSVTAVDDDFDLIQKAKKKNNNVNFQYSSFFSFAKKTNKDQFDFVVDNEFSKTIHRNELIKFYKEISKMIKYDGGLFTKAPSINSIYCKNHCPQRQWTYINGKYINFFNKRFLLDLLGKSGFKLDKYFYANQGDKKQTHHVVYSSLKIMKL